MAYITTRTRDKRDRKTGKVTKTKSYVVRWLPPGTEKEMSKTFPRLGSVTDPDTAKYFASKIEAKMRDAEYLDPDLGKTNLRAFAEKWRDRARADGTIRARQQFIDNLGPLASLSVAQVQRSDIRAWTDTLLTGRPWRKNKPISLSTTGLYLQHLTTVLNLAVEDGLRTDNPAKKFKLEGSSYEEDIAGPHWNELLTQKIIKDIVAEASDTVGTMIVLSALTGLRVSEVAGLRVRDVDFLRRILHVAKQADRSPKNEPIDTKTRSSKRTIPLSESAVHLLSEYLADESCKRAPGGLIFAAPRGGRWYATHLGNNFRRACIAADHGFDWSWHDLRHYFASRLIGKGYDVKTVSELLGHASTAMTHKVYIHLWPGNLDRLRVDMDDEVKALTTADPKPRLAAVPG